MSKTAVIGLGDMGLPIALNLHKAGHEVTGSDLRQERREMLEQAGAASTTSLAELGDCESVFLMVMNGDQVQQLVLGNDGLLKHLKPGATIIVTATIRPTEFDRIIEPCANAGIGLIDSPVSGGQAGSEAGTLTLMASGTPTELEKRKDVMEAISAKIFIMGDEPGPGMKTKAALQAGFGCLFSAVFEVLALAAKAGIDGDKMLDVVTNCNLSSPASNYCAQMVMDRKFKDTGSTMATIHKDISISLDFARDLGVPMYTTAAAFQQFQAAMTAFPGEDNWAGVKVIEQVTGVEAKRG